MKRILLFAIISPLLGQSIQPVRIIADCGPFAFIATATGPVLGASQINNLNSSGKQCDSWTLTYSSTGFSVLSMVIQDAPDSSGTPGSWVTFAGTVLSGINPNTATTSGETKLSGYYPWMRVNVTSLTGTGMITGLFYGVQSGSSAGGGGGGGTSCPNGSPCVVIGPNGIGTAPTQAPVLSAARDAAGNVYVPVFCTSVATFDTSTSGNTLLVAASGSTVVKVCRWSLTVFTQGNSVTTSLQQGTGATCGTGTATLDGAYENINSLSQDYPGGSLTGVAGNAVCLNLGSTTRVTGSISYAQF